MRGTQEWGKCEEGVRHRLLEEERFHGMRTDRVAPSTHDAKSRDGEDNTKLF